MTSQSLFTYSGVFWDKGFDAPKIDSTALRKCAKRTKKKTTKN
jgi:hypothetical protein